MSGREDLAGLVDAGRRMAPRLDVLDCETVLQMADAIEALSAENARLAASEPTCAVVKPLEWVETWSGGDEDIPSWHAQNVLGLHVGFSFSGRLVNGNHILTHSEAPDAWVAKAKAAEESKYTARILSAITMRPEAEVRAEAWASAIEVAALRMAKGGLHTVWDRSEAIRALTPPADIAAALDRIKAEAKAEGMREAAGIIREMWASTSAEHEAAILAAIPKAPR